jgi:hypothetical protein
MKEDIKPIYELLRETIFGLLSDPKIVKTTDQRTMQGLHLLSEAAQNLYAACVNLDLIEKEKDPVRQQRRPTD